MQYSYRAVTMTLWCLFPARRHRNEAPLSALRPPALVTEYLASGSLRAAITRKADFVTRDSVKIKLALDATRVSSRQQ